MYKMILWFELVALSFAYENIALRKRAGQMYSYSQRNPLSMEAANAVDGLRSDLSLYGRQCVYSDFSRQTATWWVNLKSILSIHHITIYYMTGNGHWGPTNHHANAFLGFSVFVSNTTEKSDGTLCFKDSNFTVYTIPAVFNTTCPVHGQYVIYYNERLRGVTYPSDYSADAYNNLCEVEVYGCSTPGFYGYNCSIPCPDPHCRYCHLETGTCQGCKPGYQGHRCELDMHPVTTTTVRTQPTLFTTTPNIPTTNARLQQKTMTTLLSTETTSSTTIKALLPIVTSSSITSVATNKTANGTITPALKRAIAAIVLSLLLLGSIFGFVSFVMQVKRRRNRLPELEERTIKFVNETSANLPPDSTNLDVNQSSGYLVSHDTLLEPPHEYDYITRRCSACCRDKKPSVHAGDRKIHTESHDKAKLPSHESGQADTLSSVYENSSVVDISELDDTYQYI